MPSSARRRPHPRKLGTKISDLFELRTAVERGEATFEHYAAALMSSDDALAFHYDACRPRCNQGKYSRPVLEAPSGGGAGQGRGVEPGGLGAWSASYGRSATRALFPYTGPVYVKWDRIACPGFRWRAVR